MTSVNSPLVSKLAIVGSGALRNGLGQAALTAVGSAFDVTAGRATPAQAVARTCRAGLSGAAGGATYAAVGCVAAGPVGLIAATILGMAASYATETAFGGD